MLTVKPKYCFRPKIAISKGFGLFQQLRYNLSLHFTPGLQSAFYTDRFTNRKCLVKRPKFMHDERNISPVMNHPRMKQHSLS